MLTDEHGQSGRALHQGRCAASATPKTAPDAAKAKGVSLPFKKLEMLLLCIQVFSAAATSSQTVLDSERKDADCHST
jgi:hypothetical protein